VGRRGPPHANSNLRLPRSDTYHSHDEGNARAATTYRCSFQCTTPSCAQSTDIHGVRVLIGGLGFGYTLKADLSALAADATVVMAEILAAVVAWNRNPSFNLAADAMADPRRVESLLKSS
jgi:hypothetical protein